MPCFIVRNSSFKYYKLYMSHYFSAPALSWNVMLNMTKLELQIFSYFKHLFIL